MNICVIGLGSMGKRRIRLLKATNQKMEITGIDSNIERVISVHEQYNIPCFTSLEGIADQFDCAFVCTPPLSHGKIIQECLNRDCHIFSEINLVDNMYMENIQLAKEKNKVLFLSSTPMYRAEMQFVRKRVKENGKPCAYQYHVGQYLPDWHPWDNLKDFFVSSKRTNGCREFLAIEFPWIQAAFGKIARVSVVKRKLTKLDLNFPDTYLLWVEHENGTIGNMLVDIVSRQAVRQLEVINEELYIRWSGTPDTLYEKNFVTGELEQNAVGEYIHIPGYADCIIEAAYAEEMKMFFKAIQGEKPEYGFLEDMELLKIIDEIEGVENNEYK